MDDHPRLGVSACLTGEQVRYDGGHNAIGCAKLPGAHFDLLHVCPEVAIGLGVPRPALQLREVDGEVRVCGVDDPARDVSIELERYAADVASRHSDLAGYLFKSRSPSCGLRTVAVHRTDGTTSPTGRGGYAEALLRRNPGLPSIEEDQLNDATARDSFFVRVYARHRFLQCRSPAARRHFHHCYTLASRARGKPQAQPVSLLDKRPEAYLSELLSRLEAPVVRRLDAAIIRELCELDTPPHAPPAQLQRYACGEVPRHRAVAAAEQILHGPARVNWFLHPLPPTLEKACVSV